MSFSKTKQWEAPRSCMIGGASSLRVGDSSCNSRISSVTLSNYYSHKTVGNLHLEKLLLSETRHEPVSDSESMPAIFESSSRVLKLVVCRWSFTPREQVCNGAIGKSRRNFWDQKTQTLSIADMSVMDKVYEESFLSHSVPTRYLPYATNEKKKARLKR